ncbi:MAG: adenosylcobinamide-GDP ribazoletransferase [Rhizobiaceae bacterium]|nr:adenosylcobinamide-GDP ribazoletransferase [Rhizobiaceae bacterium]
MNRLTYQFEKLAIALQFFSRIPLPKSVTEKFDAESNLAESAHLFSVIGLLLALIPSFVWYVSANWFAPTIAAGLAIATGMLLTGGLHEDGLADCADGLGGGNTRARALKIMKDSRIGTYGAAALIFSIGIRWAALASLSPYAGIFALLITHAVSRATITLAIKYSTYVRAEGIGKSVSSGIPGEQFTLTLAIAFIIALLLGGGYGVFAGVMGFLFAGAMLLFLEKRLNGYTGDGLGAMEQISEITILVILSACWAAA